MTSIANLRFLDGNSQLFRPLNKNTKMFVCVCVCVWGGGGGGVCFFVPFWGTPPPTTAVFCFFLWWCGGVCWWVGWGWGGGECLSYDSPCGIHCLKPTVSLFCIYNEYGLDNITLCMSDLYAVLYSQGTRHLAHRSKRRQFYEHLTRVLNTILDNHLYTLVRDFNACLGHRESKDMEKRMRSSWIQSS